MNKSVRRILFWLLFCLFLATTPVVILFSQGYRFDFYRMVFVHSGSITIKSEPANVDIYLNGELQAGKKLDIINNSITLSGLRPGNYALEVSAQDHGSWGKNIDVHSGLSAEYWNVVLPQHTPTLEALDSRSVVRFFPSPFGKKMAYVERANQGYSVWVVDVKDNVPALILEMKDADYLDSKLENIEWNFKENLLAIPAVRAGIKDYVIASSESEFTPFFLSSAGDIKKPEKVRWSPSDKNILFFSSESSDESGSHSDLYSFDLESRKTVKVIPGIVTYDFSQQYIYFLQKNNILFRCNLEGQSLSQITSAPFGEFPLTAEARLIVYDENRQSLLTQDGDLIVNNRGESAEIMKKIGTGIQGVQFSDDGKKLLFWSNNEISVWYLRKWEVQPYRKENEFDTVIRLSTPLTNVFWFEDYEHVLFSTKSKIKLIELDSRDRRNCAEVLDNDTENFPAVYDARAGIYYFIQDQNGERRIRYFELPEQQGIFG